MTQRPGERPEQRGQVEPRARTDEVISAKGGGGKAKRDTEREAQRAAPRSGPRSYASPSR